MTDEKDHTPPRLVSIDGNGLQSDESGQPSPVANDSAHPDDDKVMVELRQRLLDLEAEHRDLDVAIQSIEERMPYDRLTIQRLKKRKLSLKDEISKVNAAILPNIIA